MQEPRLTVVLPHLNEPDLRRCLLALDAQREAGLGMEIIVVDNGSAEIPVQACAGIPDLRLEKEPVPGPGPARNKGAMLARAPIIAFVDADCVVEPGWARAILATMDSRPEVDIIGGDIGILMTDPARPNAIESYESIYSYRARLYVERHGYAATGNMAVRASVFRAAGPFGGIETMEDTEWGQRATRLGYRTTFVAEAKVLTPSCKSFPELVRRWDRHVAHQFGKGPRYGMAKLKWLAGCAIMAASPALELFKVMTSNKVSGLRNRMLAFGCLIRVRLYRAKLMLALARRGRAVTLVENWNRET